MDIKTSLLAIMTNDELEQCIDQKVEEFHGFLSKDVAIKLIAKEKGLLKNEEKMITIKEIEKGDKNISLVAKIVRVFPVAEYESGKKSRKVIIDDGTKIDIRLWNNDVELATKLKNGDEVTIRRAYEKNGELALSYSGEFKLSKSAPFSRIKELQDNKIANVKGTVISNPLVSMREFEFVVSDGQEQMNCVAPTNLEIGKHLSDGDEVILENALFAEGKIQITGETRVLVRKTNGVIAGKIKEINISSEGLEVKIDEKEVKLDRNGFLSLFKLKLANDISLEAVASLKKDSLLNTYVRIAIPQV